jgi:hypothetical protein
MKNLVKSSSKVAVGGKAPASKAPGMQGKAPSGSVTEKVKVPAGAKVAKGGKVVLPKEGDSDTPTKSAMSGRGWQAFANKKTAAAEQQERAANSLREVYLKDGDEVMIQFLDDEPLCLDMHMVKNQHDRFETLTCGKSNRRTCDLCDRKASTVWRAAFKVLDYRGEWDKDNKEWKHDKPVEGYILVNQKTAGIIENNRKRRGSLLNDVFIYTRIGGGSTDTTYNLEVARDEHDNKIKPKMGFKEEKASVDVALAPITDTAMSQYRIPEKTPKRK